MEPGRLKICCESQDVVTNTQVDPLNFGITEVFLFGKMNIQIPYLPCIVEILVAVKLRRYQPSARPSICCRNSTWLCLKANMTVITRYSLQGTGKIKIYFQHVDSLVGKFTKTIKGVQKLCYYVILTLISP